MNKKELLLKLLNDIKELEQLSNGFIDIEIIPKSMTDLAIDKAQSILHNLRELPDNQTNDNKIEFVDSSDILDTKNKSIMLSGCNEEKPINDNNITIDRENISLADNIFYQKVDDISTAISIVDRFRFISELFNDNSELFNNTINHLNQLNNLNSAEIFLSENFGWNEDNKTAVEFLRIVKRRFL